MCQQPALTWGVACHPRHDTIPLEGLRYEAAQNHSCEILFESVRGNGDQ